MRRRQMTAIILATALALSVSCYAEPTVIYQGQVPVIEIESAPAAAKETAPASLEPESRVELVMVADRPELAEAVGAAADQPEAEEAEPAAERESAAAAAGDAQTAADTQPEAPAAADAQQEATSAAAHAYSGIAMTAEERQLLRRIVAAEAQTQKLEGRIAVVEVIFNRVLSGHYPDTIKGVLSQKGEFSTWKYRNASWVKPEYADAAIDYVLANGRTVLPDGRYVYFSRGKASYATGYIKIQDHYFGRAR